MKEHAPFACNAGVENARSFLAACIDDLPGVCIEQGLTYWDSTAGTARSVRRKPRG